jgi:hypothetical protein
LGATGRQADAGSKRGQNVASGEARYKNRSLKRWPSRTTEIRDRYGKNNGRRVGHDRSLVAPRALPVYRVIGLVERVNQIEGVARRSPS